MAVTVVAGLIVALWWGRGIGPWPDTAPSLPESEACRPRTAAVDPNATTAAERYGWGTPFAGSEFTDPNTLRQDGWAVFSGVGYQGQGVQSADMVEIDDGMLVITGDPEGHTGAVGYYDAVQQYGRWESRVRIPEGYGNYHPVALLWPSSERWPDDGEIDYLETTGSADINTFSVHHGAGTPETEQIAISREWHSYAVEWTPTSISGYLDGVRYFHLTDPSLFPPGPMWHSFQLDWMDEDGPAAIMEVDWLRIYAVCA